MEGTGKEDTDTGSYTVYVENIAPNATLEMLKVFFGYMGNVISARITQPETSGRLNTAIITFSEEKGAQGALQANGLKLLGETLAIRSKNGENGVTSDENKQEDATSGEKDDDHRILQSQSFGDNQALIHQDEIRRTVYVGGVLPHVNSNEIIDKFSEVGIVTCVKIAGDNSKPFRHAFVEFADASSAASALNLSGQRMFGNNVSVNRSTTAIAKQPRRGLDDVMERIKKRMQKIDGEKKGTEPVSEEDSHQVDPPAAERAEPRALDGEERTRGRKRSRSRDGSRSRSRTRSRSRSRSSGEDRRRRRHHRRHSHRSNGSHRSERRSHHRKRRR